MSTSESPRNAESPQWAEEILRLYHHEDILNLIMKFPAQTLLKLPFSSIKDPDKRSYILDNPDNALPELNAALREYYDMFCIDSLSDSQLKQIKVEITDIPESETVRIRDLRQDHLNHLITVEGVVWKMAPVIPKLTVAAFLCQRCEHVSYIKQNHNMHTEPFECESEVCGRRGPFKLLTALSETTDFQRLKIQERQEDLGGGEQAMSITVELTGTLAGRVLPGNKVKVVGILRAVQKVTQRGKTNEFYVILEAISISQSEMEAAITVSKEDEKRLRALASSPDIIERLIDSFAPTVHGARDVKEGILLCASSRGFAFRPDGTPQRDYIHVCVCGDPGVAKTNLKFGLKKIFPKLVFASGTGSRAAGLTAAAIKDDLSGSGWTIEAGALPLADGAGLAIDEFDKLQRDSQRQLNDALSNCQFEVDKAGFHLKLWARCFVISLLNPKDGRFDPYEPLSTQVAVPVDTLSRFDLVFIMQDNLDIKKDELIARRIYNAWLGENTQDTGSLSIEDMQKYLALAQRTAPAIKKETEEFIVAEFVRARQSSKNGKVAVTMRHMEALIRLSKAEAKLHLSETVDIIHIKRAVRLLHNSILQTCTDSDGDIDSDRLEVGRGKCQRDLVKAIRDVLQSCSKDGGALYGDIAIAVSQIGITKEQLDVYLEMMQTSGEVYKTPKGAWRLVK